VGRSSGGTEPYTPHRAEVENVALQAALDEGRAQVVGAVTLLDDGICPRLEWRWIHREYGGAPLPARHAPPARRSCAQLSQALELGECPTRHKTNVLARRAFLPAAGKLSCSWRSVTTTTAESRVRSADGGICRTITPRGRHRPNHRTPSTQKPSATENENLQRSNACDTANAPLLLANHY